VKKILLPVVLFVSIGMLCSCQKNTAEQKKNSVMRKKVSGRVKSRLLRKADKPTPKPEIGSTVLVHYVAWLAQEDGSQGRQVDSSIERGEPLQFTVGLNHVVKGFEEGVMQMQVGEKRRLFIPSDLGYGKRGVGLFIPPDSNLVFEVELLAMK